MIRGMEGNIRNKGRVQHELIPLSYCTTDSAHAISTSTAGPSAARLSPGVPYAFYGSVSGPLSVTGISFSAVTCLLNSKELLRNWKEIAFPPMQARIHRNQYDEEAFSWLAVAACGFIVAVCEIRVEMSSVDRNSCSLPRVRCPVDTGKGSSYTPVVEKRRFSAGIRRAVPAMTAGDRECRQQRAISSEA